MGGLLDGLDMKERSHLAPDHLVPLSLDGQPREDEWDCDEIVRGFSVRWGFEWSGLKAMAMQLTRIGVSALRHSD